MKRGRTFSFALFIFIILVFSSIANAETYTIDQCVEIALKNNVGVIAAENTYKSSKYGVYSAWGSLLPSIDLSTGASKSWSGFASVDQSSGKILSGGRNSYTSSLNFRNTFPGLGLANYANIKYSGNYKASNYYGFVSSKNELVFTVKEEFYNLLKSKMLLDVAIEAVKRGEERLRVVQSRYDLGSASMSDVLKAKVQYGNDRLDLVSKTNDFKLAQAQLAFTMGVDVNQEFEVDENLSGKDINITYNEAMAEALSENPDYRKAHFDLSTAKNEKTMALSNFLPSLTLQLSHSTSVDTLSQFGSFVRKDASYYVFATLNFNIFNGLGDYANLRQKKYKVRTFEENLANMKNSVALEIKRSFLDLERAREAIKLAEESVAAAQEDLNLVKEKYNLGAATILEVLDAEVSFKQAQTSHVEVMYNYNLAVSQLEKALGR